METLNLKIHGVAELSHEELTTITGGMTTRRAGELAGYAVGFVVGGVFTLMSKILL